MVASIAWRLRCNCLTFARRFNDAGLCCGWVFGSRFPLPAVLAIAAEAAFGIAEMRLDAEILPTIAAMAGHVPKLTETTTTTNKSGRMETSR